MRKKTMQAKVEETILASYESMYRLAYAHIHNREDALDIVQESAYKAMKHAADIKQEEYMKTWLWRIVMNTTLDFIRKSQKEIATENLPEQGKEDHYRDFDTLEALNVLSDKEKAVIILRFFEEQRLRDIAVILDENINTVKTILYRSLQKLKVEFM